MSEVLMLKALIAVLAMTGSFSAFAADYLFDNPHNPHTRQQVAQLWQAKACGGFLDEGREPVPPGLPEMVGQSTYEVTPRSVGQQQLQQQDGNGQALAQPVSMFPGLTEAMGQ